MTIDKEEFVTAAMKIREMEGSNFDKGYAGAPLFCKLEGLTPEQLLKIILIDLSKPDTDVEFNEGATKWCKEQLGGVQ